MLRVHVLGVLDQRVGLSLALIVHVNLLLDLLNHGVLAEIRAILGDRDATIDLFSGSAECLNHLLVLDIFVVHNHVYVSLSSEVIFVHLNVVLVLLVNSGRGLNSVVLLVDAAGLLVLLLFLQDLLVESIESALCLADHTHDLTVLISDLCDGLLILDQFYLIPEFLGDIRLP